MIAPRRFQLVPAITAHLCKQQRGPMHTQGPRIETAGCRAVALHYSTMAEPPAVHNTADGPDDAIDFRLAALSFTIFSFLRSFC